MTTPNDRPLESIKIKCMTSSWYRASCLIPPEWKKALGNDPPCMEGGGVDGIQPYAFADGKSQIEAMQSLLATIGRLSMEFTREQEVQKQGLLAQAVDGVSVTVLSEEDMVTFTWHKGEWIRVGYAPYEPPEGGPIMPKSRAIPDPTIPDAFPDSNLRIQQYVRRKVGAVHRWVWEDVQVPVPDATWAVFYWDSGSYITPDNHRGQDATCIATLVDGPGRWIRYQPE